MKVLKNINRVELIDHRPCNKCHGDRSYNELQKDRSYKLTECSECFGMGSAGRSIIFWNDHTEIAVEVQDEGRTLKLFVSPKGTTGVKNVPTDVPEFKANRNKPALELEGVTGLEELSLNEE